MPDHDTPCQAIRATIMGNSEDSLMPITETFWARRINSDRYEVCDLLYHFPLVAGDQVHQVPNPNQWLPTYSN